MVIVEARADKEEAMATQVLDKQKSLPRVDEEPVAAEPAQRRGTLIYLTAAVVLGVVIGLVALSPSGPVALTQGQLADNARYTAQAEAFDLQRGWLADTARYQAQVQAQGVVKGQIADSARYTAQAAALQDSLQRSWAADTARYQAMGMDSLGLTRGQAAEVARYQAQANALGDALMQGQAADTARWVARGEAFDG